MPNGQRPKAAWITDKMPLSHGGSISNRNPRPFPTALSQTKLKQLLFI